MNIRFHARLLNILLLVATVALLPQSKIEGQPPTNALTPIYGGVLSVTSFRWTLDGSLLTFQDFSSDVSSYAENWVVYDSLSRQLTKAKIPPTWFVFTEEQRRKFKVAPTIDLAFASPNEQFVVYLAEPDSEWKSAGWGYPVMVVNLFTNKSVSLNLPVTSDFSVIWNSGSTAFTVETTTNYAAELVYYVSSIDPSLASFSVKAISYDQVIEGRQWTIFDAYAISPDGKQVLVANGNSLLLLDFAEPASSMLVTSDVVRRAAIFNSEGDRIIYLSQEGLFSFDPTSKQRKQLNLDPNAANLRPAYAFISPSLKKIALVVFKEANMHELYIVDV